MPSIIQSRSMREEVAIPPSPPSTFVGLCSTCNNALTCVYRQKRGRDALFCEMFDSFMGNGSRPVDSTTSITEVSVKAPAKQTLKGLCINCEHRDSCTLSKPKGGVWHCEEYE